MPLLDHFRPPLSSTRHWEAFHARWASAIADALNRDLLPPGYFAEEQVHVGSRVEVDVATFEQSSSAGVVRDGGGGVATLEAQPWAPPAPAASMPAVFPGGVEVLIYSGEAGPTLVAAVELVSPSNKDRDETRRAFAMKCACYLHRGVGLVVVDTVTSREANLHNLIVGLLGNATSDLLVRAPLYAVAYRPARAPGDGARDEGQIDLWPATLAVGAALPLLPLSIGKGACVPLDLEATYTDARQRRRLP